MGGDSSGAETEAAVLPHHDITVTDVLAALTSATTPGAGNLTPRQLERYMKTHVHGSQAPSEDWVMVG
jgi:hypothetical protein